jgi:PDZ domain-containing protein
MWMAIIAVPVVVLAAVFWPIAVFYMYLPGPVVDVERRIEVEGARTYSSEGRLYMTTVGVDVNVTAVEMLLAAFDRNKVVVLASDVTRGRSLEHLERVQRQEMTDSKRDARAVALSALGLGNPTGNGARVIDTRANGPAHEVLYPEDVVTSVDGRPVETACDVASAVEDAGVGGRLRVEVRRAGQTKRVTLRAAQHPHDATAAYIGVSMTTVDYHFDPDVEVGFRTGKVAGPSAGLMFAIALYDRLTAEDITGGRTIAGTGTIDCDGGVGRIAGIEQKVASAELRGADIFLSPQANAAAARAVASGVEVVEVTSFAEALAYLRAGGS